MKWNLFLILENGHSLFIYNKRRHEDIVSLNKKTEAKHSDFENINLQDQSKSHSSAMLRAIFFLNNIVR